MIMSPKRRRIAKTYIEAFKDLPGITPMREAPWAFSNFWMFTVLCRCEAIRHNSRQLLKALAEKKIQSRPLWQPLHLSPAHAGCHPQPCKTAEMLYENCLSLPCSVGLAPSDLERVVGAVCKSARHLIRKKGFMKTGGLEFNGRAVFKTGAGSCRTASWRGRLMDTPGQPVSVLPVSFPFVPHRGKSINLAC